MNTGTAIERTLRRLSHWSLIIAFAISVLSLTGWALGSTILTGIKTNYIPIAPSTAFCFFILSSSFLVYTFIPGTFIRTITAFCASLTILLVSIVLISFFMGTLIEAEHLWFTRINFLTPYKSGHMSPVTAILFIAASSGILLLCLPDRKKQVHKDIASFMELGVGTAGLIMVLGYLHGTPLLYGGTMIPVAFPTALAFIFLGSGIMIAAGPSVPLIRIFTGPSMYSRLTRAFLPVTVACVLITDVIDTIALSLTINTALTSSLTAIFSALVIGTVITKIAKSIGSDIDLANKERDGKEILVRESDKRLQSILDNSGIVFFLKDLKGHYMMVNRRFEELFHLTRQAVAGKSDYDLFPDEYASKFRKHDLLALEKGSSFKVEELVPHDDSMHTYIATKFPLLGSDGKPYAVCGIATDITDRKQAEIEIKQNESRLRRLVDIMQYKPSDIQEFLDYALEQVIQLTKSRIGYIYHYNEDSKKFVLNTWSREVMAECAITNPQTCYELNKTGIWGEAVRQRGPVIVNDFRAANPLKKGYPEGHVQLLKFMTVPILKGENIVGVVGLGNKENDYDETDILQASLLMEAVWNVIESKQAEQEMLKAKDFSENLIQTANVIFVELNASGEVVRFNPAAEKITGYSQAELAGKNWFEILVPRERFPQVWEEFNNLTQQRTFPRIFENPILTKAGLERYIVWQNNLLWQDDKIIGTISFGIDITERKQAEEEKAKLESKLVQSQKIESVGRLAGGVAHDFNNMLGVIIGHVELAMEELDKGHPLLDNLQEIKKAAERSSNLTRQLLAFARKQTISPKVIDINETIEGMLQMLRRLIGEDLHLVWLPAVNMWPVKIDPSQVDQILANLCVNARDAIEGVGKVTIETGTISFDESYCADHAGFIPGDYALIAVSDNGCGMESEILSHLFEPFFTTKDFGKGTGLGLSMVYGIVKQNNGFINVYSEPDQGTTFRIYLPRHTDKEETTRTEELQEPIMCSQETILLVEDEPSLLNMSKLMLEKQGYNVLAAETPDKAIRLAEAQTCEIHLLITDVVMPVMNGRDLAKKLLLLHPTMKCLFMSGYTANVIAHHGILDKGIHFIQKPFSRKNLAAKVREALDHK